MMDHKPIITYSGDTNVFQAALPSLQKGIGVEAVEWKRAYGRSTKHVHLHPRFVPFENPDQIKNPSTAVLNSLLDQPMLHTFWTDCSDVEVYRGTTKEIIQSWLNSVKLSNIKEWLIVLVEQADNKRTNKLLPRSTVLDKIKNDFAQKQTERCVCLADPQKIDSKSAESLNSMLHRVRQLLLASYSKTLTRFEENMRSQREKRNEVGWNFCHYFLLQEELAFVLEMLEVHDEALVQYDELDALFTQFVLNSHLTDTPQWLLSFQRFGDRWPALSLSTNSFTVLKKIRESIKNSTVSLLNFRNYLFARQAMLLIKQQRIHELAERSLAFLHNCINELSILDVTFTEEGAISCWVFVSCLEILAAITTTGSQSGNTELTKNAADETLSNNFFNVSDENGTGKRSRILHRTTSVDFSVHTACLWDYAREKLYELGKLCGLLPKCQLKSDHLHKVISLSAGLYSYDDITNGNEGTSEVSEKALEGKSIVISTNDEDTPIERLKTALSSKETFQQSYLELCELATGTYKHIGRLRSARKVGLSLASYYIDAGDFSKATSFLIDALGTFTGDKWDVLVVDVLLKLAACYQAVNDLDKYIKTCAQLACSKSLDDKKRNHFFDEMLNTLTQLGKKDRFIISPSEASIVVNNVTIKTDGKISGSHCEVQVELDLISNLPRPVASNLIQISILHCDHIPKQLGYSTAGAFLVNGHGGGNAKSKTAKPLNKRGSAVLDAKRKDSGGSSSDLDNLKDDQVLRKESVTPSITCEDEDNALLLLETDPLSTLVDLRQQLESGGTGKLIESGNSVIRDHKCLSGKLFCHNPHQSLRRKDSTQVKEAETNKTDFSEAAEAYDVIINPGSNKIILAAKVSVAGSYRLAQVSIDVKNFELLSPRLGCRYKFCVIKESPTIELHAVNLVAGIEQVVAIQVHTGSYCIPEKMTLPIRSSLGLKLKVLNQGEFTNEAALNLSPTAPFTYTRIEFLVKADLDSHKDSTVIEHKIIATCPWTEEDRKLAITFVPPFISTYKLHTVGQRKFLQVGLTGNSDNIFELSEHQLNVQPQNATNVPLVSLNPKSQTMKLHCGKCAMYMWEIGVMDVDDELPLRLEFSTKFHPKKSNSEVYKYYIRLQKFKTLFEIKSRVEPHKGTEFCRVSNMCSMNIEIISMKSGSQHKDADTPQTSLMYEVRADQHMWAICGRSSGVIVEENGELQGVTLDVMPMTPGFLPLPTVHLSKYIPADQKGGSTNVPKLEPFNCGQVYNRSKGTQVHVLPPPQSLGSASGLSGGSSGLSSLPITTYDG